MWQGIILINANLLAFVYIRHYGEMSKGSRIHNLQKKLEQ